MPRYKLSPEERSAEQERKEKLRNIMDAIHFRVRSEGQIIKKAVYIAKD